MYTGSAKKKSQMTIKEAKRISLLYDIEERISDIIKEIIIGIGDYPGSQLGHCYKRTERLHVVDREIFMSVLLVENVRHISIATVLKKGT